MKLNIKNWSILIYALFGVGLVFPLIYEGARESVTGSINTNRFATNMLVTITFYLLSGLMFKKLKLDYWVVCIVAPPICFFVVGVNTNLRYITNGLHNTFLLIGELMLIAIFFGVIMSIGMFIFSYSAQLIFLLVKEKLKKN